MSAAKFTPGPWTAMLRPAPSYSDHGWRALAMCGQWMVGAPKSTVIQVERGIVIGTKWDNEANARLMAAAPELLQELKLAAELLASLSTECRTACIDGERVDVLAAAERFDGLIAKVTGEEA